MDLSIATSTPNVREFFAVVLAGFGSELIPLTSDDGDEPCPKSLIPVGNKPIIDYVLAWIEASGVRGEYCFCNNDTKTLTIIIKM